MIIKRRMTNFLLSSRTDDQIKWDLEGYYLQLRGARINAKNTPNKDTEARLEDVRLNARPYIERHGHLVR